MNLDRKANQGTGIEVASAGPPVMRRGELKNMKKAIDAWLERRGLAFASGSYGKYGHRNIPQQTVTPPHLS